jgi:hypothetical protein
MLCHLYEAEGTRQKQYYTKVDYAYLNLFCSSKEWLVKGTTEHGMRSLGTKKSRVPCLNCYQISDDFYEALEKHLVQNKKRYEFGLVLNKRALRKHFGESNVRDVDLWTIETVVLRRVSAGFMILPRPVEVSVRLITVVL